MAEKLKQEPSNLIKIVLYGPESTGKTTLAKQLAAHYQTVWVPEYAREYLQQKWDTTQQICELSDLVPIAEGQIALENTLSKKAHKVLICDTDILETKVYSEAYFDDYCDPELSKYALQNSYDLYFLTDVDVPWEADDLRDRPDQREAMFNLFKTALIKYRRTFVLLSGSKQERFLTAKKHIDNLLRMIDLTEKDLAQLENKGIAKEKVSQQIATFKEGIPFVNLEKAAVVGEGIVRVTNEQELVSFYESNLEGKTILKFVPASGAASRMFKAMFNFVDAFDPSSERLSTYIERTGG